MKADRNERLSVSERELDKTFTSIWNEFFKQVKLTYILNKESSKQGIFFISPNLSLKSGNRELNEIH